MGGGQGHSDRPRVTLPSSGLCGSRGYTETSTSPLDADSLPPVDLPGGIHESVRIGEGYAMARKRWLVRLEDGVHDVSVEHAYWTGRCKITADNHVIETSGNFWDSGSEHQFALAGHVCTVKIEMGALGAKMILLIDGLESSTFVPSGDAGAGGDGSFQRSGEVERIIERQVVVTRCRFCAYLTPVDLDVCRHCGAPTSS